MNALKKSVVERCAKEIQHKLNNINLAMDAAQGSANEEEKSTAGDKHDTARAMSHLATEMNSKQLQEAQQQKSLFASIDFKQASTSIEIGSLVHAGDNYYLIAVGLGVLEVEGKTIAVCSPTAPITQAMLGKKVGDTFQFNQRIFNVNAIA
jgi:hypothetical protein